MTAGPAAERGLQQVAAAGDDLERIYADDAWYAADLGLARTWDNSRVSFAKISQPWLRHAAKRWARQRLATGSAFGTVISGALALKRFSAFLELCSPPVEQPEQIDRELLARYLAWLTRQQLASSTKDLSRSFLRSFLEENRRHQWLPRIAADAVLYPDELSSWRASIPRFIPEDVMAQLEADSSRAVLPAHVRQLVVLLTETGLRSGDACRLSFNPLVTDSAGWSCLRFQCAKMRNEQLLPLSAGAVDAIVAQQEHVTRCWPHGSPWLFPSLDNPALPISCRTLRRHFTQWQERIGLHDQAGKPVRVTPHQLRHTLGTRLINSGVPQHVVQRLLGHASPRMTAVYAQLHDSTIRAEFERYCQTRVDVEGHPLGFDPHAITADAEWIKHQLSRVADTLPNGYCGRPPQQDCPHPNACLTCPDFQTTAEFLPVHRQQAQLTQAQLTEAETTGRARLATNHRKVLINLNKIIESLESLRPSDEATDD